MNNTDKLLSDIANDVVLAYLRDDIEFSRIYERDDAWKLGASNQKIIHNRVAAALEELAAFFERTIE